MKNFILVNLVLSMLVSGILMAKPIDDKLAKQIAKNFYWERGTQLYDINYADLTLTLTYTKEVNGTNLYYAFDVFFNDKKGYIVVTADDAAYPVLSYSFEGNYPHSTEASAFNEWMDMYSAQILDVKTNNLEADANISDEWSRLETLNETKNTKQITAVTPMIQTLWDQYTPYNELCPNEPNFSSGKCFVGCYAIAVAQIMKYWEWPLHGTGSHSYTNTWTTNPQVVSADFAATTYDWASMINQIGTAHPSAQKTPIQTALYHVGVSLDMHYTNTYQGSTASYSAPAYALKTYWKYKTTAEAMIKSNYTDVVWKGFLKTDLDAGRPLVYAGGSHAFVCDGYQGTSDDYFHFNFGDSWTWPNGYYYLTSINPGSNFTSTQLATKLIEPIGGASIKENTSDDNVSIYPNPASDKFYIEINDIKSVQIKLLNVIGEVVLCENIETSSYVNVSNLSEGLYFAEIFYADNQKITKKIVVE